MSALTRFTPRLESAATVIRRAWDRLHALPGGKTAFTRMIGLAAPYTGTIDARVVRLERGHATVELKDSRATRNHLRCVHAIALANLAELTANVALAYSLPDDARFIPTKLSIEYLAKARGTIRGICNCPVPESNAREDYLIHVELVDGSGQLVARSSIRTRVGPVRGA